MIFSQLVRPFVFNSIFIKYPYRLLYIRIFILCTSLASVCRLSRSFNPAAIPIIFRFPRDKVDPFHLHSGNSKNSITELNLEVHLFPQRAMPCTSPFLEMMTFETVSKSNDLRLRKIQVDPLGCAATTDSFVYVHLSANMLFTNERTSIFLYIQHNSPMFFELDGQLLTHLGAELILLGTVYPISVTFGLISKAVVVG